MAAEPPLVVNGWTIFAHPLFLDQLDVLIGDVEQARSKDPAGYKRKNAAKRLAAIARLAFQMVPQDPERSDYRQGDTLGVDRKHWMRAKLFQQYRLFFRFRKAEKIIVYAWVNDESSLRAYGSKTDAYSVFRKMLDKKRPPDDWTALKAECLAAGARLTAAADRVTSAL
ncbi:MAG: type II toxin-antitoxin system YhaV family toxin [Kiloniellales bacterium]